MLNFLKSEEAAKQLAAHRLKVAFKLHEIEGMVATPDQIAMFEMFEREGLTIDEQVEHIKSLYSSDAE